MALACAANSADGGNARSSCDRFSIASWLTSLLVDDSVGRAGVVVTVYLTAGGRDRATEGRTAPDPREDGSGALASELVSAPRWAGPDDRRWQR